MSDSVGGSALGSAAGAEGAQDRAVDAGARERWRQYLEAAVVVDLAGRLVDLTGTHAVHDWPFEGSVFALTAWDPSGRACTRDENERNNSSLRAELTAGNAQVWDSAGYAVRRGGSAVAEADFGAFLDQGFIVSGLTEDEVLETARRFGQEAIYRIDDSQLTVIATRTSESESRPRR